MCVCVHAQLCLTLGTSFFFFFSLQRKQSLFCTQGQAHSPGIRVHLRVQASPAGVRLSPTRLGKGHGGPRLPSAREELSCPHRQLSKSGDSFLSQLFDEGHLIPIPDTIISEFLPVFCELLSRGGQVVCPPHVGPADVLNASLALLPELHVSLDGLLQVQDSGVLDYNHGCTSRRRSPASGVKRRAQKL